MTPEAMFKGNKDAMELVATLSRIANIWDDLVDRDKPVGEKEINECFWHAFVTLPDNAFYRAHWSELRPVLITGILNYVAANEMERRGDRKSLEIAHVCRYSIADVCLLIAAIIGGPEWGMACAADLRLAVQDETLDEYLMEKAQNEKARRVA